MMSKSFIFIMLLSLPVMASDSFSKLHMFQIYYSGKDEKTFSNDNPGTGIEVELSTLNERFNLISKARLTTISGTQDFSDGGTSRSSDFTFYQGSFEGGFTFYPLERKRRAINIYTGFTGILSLNHLRLDSTALTVLSSSYQAMSFGYSAVVGVEWFVADRICISAEISQRYEKVNLAKQSAFDLGGFSIAAGFGW